MHVDLGNLCFSELNFYTLKFVMRTAAGAAVTGITSMGVFRSKNQEFPAAVRGPIAVTASPGPHASPPSIVEVDAANMPGVYEFKGTVTDMDSAGPAAWRFVDVVPGTAEDTYVIAPHLLREATLDA